jgi:hypothetical protein
MQEGLAPPVVQLVGANDFLAATDQVKLFFRKLANLDFFLDFHLLNVFHVFP